MINIGFKRGLASPCVFHHTGKGLRVVIHGDDFTVLGKEESLDWFRDHIQGSFEVKFKARLGPNRRDDKSVRILNRVVYWTGDGIVTNLTRGNRI